MLFNSLSTLLLAPRNGQLVTFSADKTIYWQQFLNDIRLLVELINSNECTAIAICCDDSYLFSVAFFATIYADKKVILPGNHQPAMLASLACEFDLFIDDGLVSQTVKESFVDQSIVLPLKNEPSNHFKFTELNLDELNITLFTSGSTGVPKAINKTLLMLDAEIQALEKQFGALLQQTRVVSTVSHQHIYGLLFRVLWPLCSARAFASSDLIYPEQVIAKGSQEQTLISSPALLKRLKNEGVLGDYRAVFSSGGPLSSTASDSCKQLLNCTAIEVFGSTETGGVGFRQQHDADSPWTFFPEVSAKLGYEGCLTLISPWISEGSGDYYQTNDQCDLLEDQQFRLKGRIDRIVKIEEKRVSLIEVETHINELDWISESAVIVVDEAQRITLGALLVLTEQGKQELSLLGKGRFWIKLRQSLRQWLEPVGIPRHFRLALEIPLNKQGKRLHQEIVELFK
ncbi:MAG: acyl-CoA synthetase [Psychromonas sp.]|nr:acyl-CoA synthetase [Psychromonas sp.]